MPQEKINFDYSVPNTLLIKISGDWVISSELPSVNEIEKALSGRAGITQLSFDLSGLTKWDSGFVSFILQIIRYSQNKNIHVSRGGLPQGVEKFLKLALKANETEPMPPQAARLTFLAMVGDKAIKIREGVLSLLDFLGEIAFAFWRFFRGKAYFCRDDFVYIVQRCGVDALPLVSLISMLVGIILAFVGVIQLELFGAQIFIADIVGIAMVRVMGAVMTGILLSGRTGASFAAELGIMQTNEEVDALRTLGVNPVEYLVMPRVLALIIMMPLLTIYADLMGIIGGFAVSTGFLGINPVEYLNHTKDAVTLNNLWIGITHGLVFGIIISVAGCLRGIRCGRSAAGVGEATTSAVVSAITGIVIATAIITFICQVLRV
ncbi:MAG: ABC transporter permease [Candidatus Omnitrophota bacterium]|jgi:phospholipid/cholesterol/gamma-HCH transport system permease protein